MGHQGRRPECIGTDSRVGGCGPERSVRDGAFGFAGRGLVLGRAVLRPGRVPLGPGHIAERLLRSPRPHIVCDTRFRFRPPSWTALPALLVAHMAILVHGA
jgi:hypothetical protein